jgi:hypothetical protein
MRPYAMNKLSTRQQVECNAAEAQVVSQFDCGRARVPVRC